MMKNRIASIHFNFLVKLSLNKRKHLKAFLLKLFESENIVLERLTYIFCSDAYLLKLNRNFLKHDTYTDIITFRLSEEKEPIIGEIYISIERVKENALKYNTSMDQELHRVIFHGALHLCGYEDKNKKQREKMRGKEDMALLQYGVPR